MKTLLIFRHAKAASGLPVPDHDRPLSARGERQAPQVGQRLKAENLVPQWILSSTAERARTTAELCAEACGYREQIELVSGLYMADVDQLIRIIRQLPDEHDTVMLVGHNPGLEQLVGALAQVQSHMSTASLAEVQAPTDRWAGLNRGDRCVLRRLWQSPE